MHMSTLNVLICRHILLMFSDMFNTSSPYSSTNYVDVFFLIFQKGLYLHEIGHAIGLVHEHQLPNRDQYIEILYQNVEPSMRIWFNKYASQEVDQMKVPYEYSSVMHYGVTVSKHEVT